jgi:hypothetical protein
MLYMLIANRLRRQKELRDEKEDQEVSQELGRMWEESEAATEDADLERAIRLSQLVDAEDTEDTEDTVEDMNDVNSLGESSTAGTISRKRPKKDAPSEDANAPTLELWSALNRLKQENRLLRHQLRHSSEAVPPLAINRIKIRIENYKRQKGKKLTQEERRAVLHMFEFLLEEKKNGKIVSTADPKQRIASYMGMSLTTVNDTVLNRNTQDRRGKHLRYIHANLFASDLRQIVLDLNTKGKCVSLNIIRNRLKDDFDDKFEIPGREAIRLAMLQMKFHYKHVNKTRGFVESEDIKKKRRHYLQEKWSNKYENVIFVYLDESYCNLNHVSNKALQTIQSSIDMVMFPSIQTTAYHLLHYIAYYDLVMVYPWHGCCQKGQGSAVLHDSRWLGWWVGWRATSLAGQVWRFK